MIRQGWGIPMSKIKFKQSQNWDLGGFKLITTILLLINHFSLSKHDCA